MNNNKTWLIVLFALVLMTSCNSNDDNDKVNEGSYIVTEQPLYIGRSSAVLKGEFYSDRIPSEYRAKSTPLSLGIELSLTEDFRYGNVYPVYAQSIKGNSMEVTLNGLSPDTKYYYRAFIDTGATKLYGEKLSFNTQVLQLACSVENVKDISFATASFTIRSTESASTLLSEGFVYGVAYSTDENLLLKTQTDISDQTGIVFQQLGYNSEDVTITVNDLKSGQTYYYCAYTASKDYGICQFGPVKSFTTESMEKWLAIDAIDAKFIMAEVTGHTLFSESNKDLRYVFKYSMVDVDYPPQYEVTMDLDSTSLSALVENLSPNHRYESWITVIQDGHIIGQSEKKEFRTQNPGDYILLDDATDITSTSAVINFTLSPYAYEDYASGQIYWGQDKHNLTRMQSPFLDDNHMTAKLTNLQPNTTYYYCAQALCILRFGWGEWFYSETKSFTTLPSEP